MVTQPYEIEKSYREAVTDFTTDSGITLKGVYNAEDISDIDNEQDIGRPGEYPFTRGHHPQMYRGKLSTETSLKVCRMEYPFSIRIVVVPSEK